jgi:hypothetical protein
MDVRVASKRHGELLRDKNKLAYSCCQTRPTLDSMQLIESPRMGARAFKRPSQLPFKVCVGLRGSVAKNLLSLFGVFEISCFRDQISCVQTMKFFAK